MLENSRRLVVTTPEGAGHCFGQDIQSQLESWWKGPLRDELRDRFNGEPFEVAGLVWLESHLKGLNDPLMVGFLHYLGNTQSVSYVGPNGLFRDALGMMRFFLRAGHTSATAVSRGAHLLAPGDYPHPGAIEYQGFLVAVSASLPGHNDYAARKLAEKVVELRSAAARAALNRFASDDSPEARYLGADPAEVNDIPTFWFA